MFAILTMYKSPNNTFEESDAAPIQPYVFSVQFRLATLPNHNIKKNGIALQPIVPGTFASSSGSRKTKKITNSKLLTRTNLRKTNWIDECLVNSRNDLFTFSSGNDGIKN